jgi:hypothetical protein
MLVLGGVHVVTQLVGGEPELGLEAEVRGGVLLRRRLFGRALGFDLGFLGSGFETGKGILRRFLLLLENHRATASATRDDLAGAEQLRLHFFVFGLIEAEERLELAVAGGAAEVFEFSEEEILGHERVSLWVLNCAL